MEHPMEQTERRRLTERFPWLLPLRVRQRRLCFYLGLRLDGEDYALRQAPPLGWELFSSTCPMYNVDTGFDMVYQRNKVENLKLAATAMDGLLILPGQTFSFCLASHRAGRQGRYRDGLAVVNGSLTTVSGGGLCMLSNLLFWVCLHGPLTIVERHGHSVRDFPEPPSDAPLGVDATIAEGWLDLKVRNDTQDTFQLGVSFSPTHITGVLRTDRDPGFRYGVENGAVRYVRRGGKVFEEAQVVRTCQGGEGAPALLYTNCCEIGYPLPAGTPVETEGEN